MVDPEYCTLNEIGPTPTEARRSRKGHLARGKEQLAKGKVQVARD